MNSREITLFSVILGLFVSLFLFPWIEQGIPIVDFILAYFRPAIGWKRVIEYRFFFIGLSFAINPALVEFLMRIEYEGKTIGPFVILMTIGNHFLYIFIFDKVFSKKNWPRGL